MTHSTANLSAWIKDCQGHSGLFRLVAVVVVGGRGRCKWPRISEKVEGGVEGTLVAAVTAESCFLVVCTRGCCCRPGSTHRTMWWRQTTSYHQRAILASARVNSHMWQCHCDVWIKARQTGSAADTSHRQQLELLDGQQGYSMW